MSPAAPTAARIPTRPSAGNRSQWWWPALGALAALQLVAFGLVCSHQVRKAETRRTEVLVQQMALADCLRYIPGATIASCAGTGPIQVGTAASQGARAGAAIPVSYQR